MVYSEFEQIISSDRMRKYLTACGGDTRRAMTLLFSALGHSSALSPVRHHACQEHGKARGDRTARANKTNKKYHERHEGDIP